MLGTGRGLPGQQVLLDDAHDLCHESARAWGARGAESVEGGVAHLFRVQGKNLVPIPSAIPGDLCAVTKVEDLHVDAVHVAREHAVERGLEALPVPGAERAERRAFAAAHASGEGQHDLANLRLRRKTHGLHVGSFVNQHLEHDVGDIAERDVMHARSHIDAVAGMMADAVDGQAERLGGEALTYAELGGQSFDVIINATSAGLTGAMPPLPEPSSLVTMSPSSGLASTTISPRRSGPNRSFSPSRRIPRLDILGQLDDGIRRLKRRYDPDLRFQSEWWRHYAPMFE